MKLGLATELVGDHLIHTPVLWKDQLVLLLVFFQRALEPREATPCVLEVRIWLSRLEDLLVRTQNEVGEPHLHVADCCWSKGVDGVARRVELLLVLDTPLDVLELLEDLHPQLVAEVVPFLLQTLELLHI